MAVVRRRAVATIPGWRELSSSWRSPGRAGSQRSLPTATSARVVIGGAVIASGDDGDYGISEGGLALLRTLDQPHTADHPIAEHLIPHGCGTMLMMGCPIGLDWEVRHRGDDVLLSNVIAYPTTAESDEAPIRGRGSGALRRLPAWRRRLRSERQESLRRVRSEGD